jgi:hypothetical protein
MAQQILTEEGVYDANGAFKTQISYRDVVRGWPTRSAART